METSNQEIKLEKKDDVELTPIEQGIINDINNELKQNESRKTYKLDNDRLKEETFWKRNIKNPEKIIKTDSKTEGITSPDEEGKKEENTEKIDPLNNFIKSLSDRLNKVEDIQSIIKYNYENINQKYEKIARNSSDYLYDFHTLKENSKETLSKFPENKSDENYLKIEKIGKISEYMSNGERILDTIKENKDRKALKSIEKETGLKMSLDGAISQFQKALELNPNENIAKLELKKISELLYDEGIRLTNDGDIQGGKNKFEKIIDIYLNILKINPENQNQNGESLYDKAIEGKKKCEELEKAKILIEHESPSYNTRPNPWIPSKGQLNIELGVSNPHGMNSFQITDLSGRVLDLSRNEEDFRNHVLKNYSTDKLNFFYKNDKGIDFKGGIYLFTLRNDNGFTITKEIIVAKS